MIVNIVMKFLMIKWFVVVKVDVFSSCLIIGLFFVRLLIVLKMDVYVVFKIKFFSSYVIIRLCVCCYNRVMGFCNKLLVCCWLCCGLIKFVFKFW